MFKFTIGLINLIWRQPKTNIRLTIVTRLHWFSTLNAFFNTSNLHFLYEICLNRLCVLARNGVWLLSTPNNHMNTLWDNIFKFELWQEQDVDTICNFWYPIRFIGQAVWNWASGQYLKEMGWAPSSKTLLSLNSWTDFHSL